MNEKPEKTPAALAVSLSTIRHTNMGDHGERLREDHEYVPGETVEELARRLFPDIGAPFRSHDASDVIEVRVMVNRHGKIAGEPETLSEVAPW